MLKSRNRIASKETVSNARSNLIKNELANAIKTQQSNTVSAAQVLRKRRSSINVYDQPSSLNSRLRQLETDMLRLDEDRTKLYDDTHSTLAQYELKLNEIQAILRSRQDNVEKYVDDMKILLEAKTEFESQIKLLKERHERLQDKFTQRETNVSREIKLMKNKFELLEKDRTFRSILQKTARNSTTYCDTTMTNETNQYQADNQSSHSILGDAGQSILPDGMAQSNIHKFNSAIGDNKIRDGNRFKMLVNNLINFPTRLFRKSSSHSSQHQHKYNRNGPFWRFVRLISWWCSCKRRPSSSTTQ